MHRLFVALRPPEPVRDLLLDTMDGAPALRWQDDEQLHLTLRFIGEVERPLAALAAKVERVCVKVGLPPERRAYHPHITLARWGRGVGTSLDPWLARHGALRSDEFPVDAFTLYESRLGRDGAHYETVARYPLG